jgi:hypothetical protein
MADDQAGAVGMEVGSEDVSSDSSDENSDGSSDSEDVEMGAADMSRLMELEGNIKDNPNVYDTHLEVTYR